MKTRDHTRAPDSVAPGTYPDGGAQEAAQRAIACFAAHMCQPGDTVALNGGKATAAMLEFLAMPLTVLTNSFQLAHRLLLRSGSEVYLTAGTVCRQRGLIYCPFDLGPAPVQASKLFTGAYALGQHGVADVDVLRIQAGQQLMRMAQQTIVLADSASLSVKADLIMCHLGQVDCVVTDTRAPDLAMQMLERAGIRVFTVHAGQQALPYH